MLLFGIGFVFIASVAASVAMIFQKRAHAHPPFYKHIQWWVGITLAACASIVDAVAMHYIRTSTIAVLACMSIPINVVVSWWLLSETTTHKQRIYLASAIIGIITAILAVPHEDPTPDDLQQFTRIKNIVTLSILAAAQIYLWSYDQVRDTRNPFIYAVLAGMTTCPIRNIRHRIASHAENDAQHATNNIHMESSVHSTRLTRVHAEHCAQGRRRHTGDHDISMHVVRIQHTAWNHHLRRFKRRGTSTNGIIWTRCTICTTCYYRGSVPSQHQQPNEIVTSFTLRPQSTMVLFFMSWYSVFGCTVDG